MLRFVSHFYAQPYYRELPDNTNTHVAYVGTYLSTRILTYLNTYSTGEVRMLEPDSFATNNLFPAGKSENHGVSPSKLRIKKKHWHAPPLCLKQLVEALSANAYIFWKRQCFKFLAP